MARLLLMAMLISCLAQVFSQPATSGETPGTPRAQAPLHSPWTALLGKYVDADGGVNYKGFQADRTALDAYLNVLVKNVPAASATKQEQLAFYINLYNAATVKLILDNYPVKSIREIKDPWGRNWIPLAGSLRSLGYIEHELLRKMGDARIHFAINCASVSCPKLAPEAYTASGLEGQLEKAARNFIQDTTRNRLGNERLQLSQIFNWYKKDFAKHGGLTAYLAPYAPVTIDPGAKITYLRYDWHLNEAK